MNNKMVQPFTNMYDTKWRKGLYDGTMKVLVTDRNLYLKYERTHPSGDVESGIYLYYTANPIGPRRFERTMTLHRADGQPAYQNSVMRNIYYAILGTYVRRRGDLYRRPENWDQIVKRFHEMFPDHDQETKIWQMTEAYKWYKEVANMMVGTDYVVETDFY